MKTINPYLNFSGNTEEAFEFYKGVFGGEFTALQRFKEMPEAGKIPREYQEKIVHIALPLGKGNVLMGTDAVEGLGHKLTFGNNISLSIEAESMDEANKLFAGLSSSGKIEMPLQNMFWGAYYGMLTDKFGVQWMINYDPKKSK